MQRNSRRMTKVEKRNIIKYVYIAHLRIMVSIGEFGVSGRGGRVGINDDPYLPTKHSPPCRQTTHPIDSGIIQPHLLRTLYNSKLASAHVTRGPEKHLIETYISDCNRIQCQGRGRSRRYSCTHRFRSPCQNLWRTHSRLGLFACIHPRQST